MAWACCELIEGLTVEGTRRRRRPVKMFGETVRKDVSLFRVTETKALNKVKWKNKAHKGNHK